MELKQGRWTPIVWLIVPMTCALVVMLLASRRGTAEQGLTCVEMGWYPASRGAECAADCDPTSCKRKQWCRTGPCEPYPHYCWACPEGPPPSPKPSPGSSPSPGDQDECAIVPTFTVSDSAPNPGVRVDFSVSTRGIRLPVNMDFGDGQHCIDCGASISHTYYSFGEFNAVLTAIVRGCEQPRRSQPVRIKVGGDGGPGPSPTDVPIP